MGRLANQECLNVDEFLAFYREAAFTYPVAQVAHLWELIVFECTTYY